jgi:carbamoyl-phosphate synthase small subunit
MTYPHVGNYGIAFDDFESHQIQVSGFIVREFSRVSSNWRAERDLDDVLKTYGVIGLSEVDTRALALHIRQAGAMKGCLSSEADAPQELVARARGAPSISEQDLVAQVTCTESYRWDEPSDPRWTVKPERADSLHVVVYDFGIKRNILRNLRDHVRRITVVPAQTPAGAALRRKPDGILLSNGPGDPECADYAVKNIRTLLERANCPIFGICLGHQILGLALGAHSYKLKFGHRGGNQPVKNLLTGRVEITTHNHGFALRDLPPELEVTHINLNDGTIEGMKLKGAKHCFSVQYHPEAAPGPHDAGYLFKDFVHLMVSAKEEKRAQAA